MQEQLRAMHVQRNSACLVNIPTDPNGQCSESSHATGTQGGETETVLSSCELQLKVMSLDDRNESHGSDSAYNGLFEFKLNWYMMTSALFKCLTERINTWLSNRTLGKCLKAHESAGNKSIIIIEES